MSPLKLAHAEFAGLVVVLAALVGALVWLHAYADTLALVVLVFCILMLMAGVLRAATLLASMVDERNGIE